MGQEVTGIVPARSRSGGGTFRYLYRQKRCQTTMAEGEDEDEGRLTASWP